MQSETLWERTGREEMGECAPGMHTCVVVRQWGRQKSPLRTATRAARRAASGRIGETAATVRRGGTANKSGIKLMKWGEQLRVAKVSTSQGVLTGFVMQPDKRRCQKTEQAGFGRWCQGCMVAQRMVDASMFRAVLIG